MGCDAVMPDTTPDLPIVGYFARYADGPFGYSDPLDLGAIPRSSDKAEQPDVAGRGRARHKEAI